MQAEGARFVLWVAEELQSAPERQAGEERCLPGLCAGGGGGEVMQTAVPCSPNGLRVVKVPPPRAPHPQMPLRCPCRGALRAAGPRTEAAAPLAPPPVPERAKRGRVQAPLGHEAGGSEAAVLLPQKKRGRPRQWQWRAA